MKTSKVLYPIFNEAMNNPNFYFEGLKLEFSEIIYKLMKKNKLNQNQLSLKLGVNRAWVCRILQGKENLTMETMAKILFILGSELKLSVKKIEKLEAE